jgi:hypothetical protein
LAAGIFLPLMELAREILPNISLGQKILFLYVLPPLLLKIIVIYLIRSRIDAKN